MKSKSFALIIAFIITMWVGCLFPHDTSTVFAATWDDINQSEVFLKQVERNSCTLCAATMLVRRVAIMDGRTNWRSITEPELRKVMDWYGIGLEWDFTYDGIRIVHGTLPTDYDSKVSKLISLINSCPEGVVVYDEYPWSPGRDDAHAVLLTGYSEGVFYCADPANSTPAGIIPISSSLISVSSLDTFWYCSSPIVHLDGNPVSSAKYNLDIKYCANGGVINDETDYCVGGEDIIYDRLGMAVAAQRWQTGSCSDGGLISASQFSLARTGYRFTGWSTVPSGGRLFTANDPSITSNDLFPDIVSQNGQITMYAQWEIINCEPTVIAYQDDHLFALYDYPLSFAEAKKFCEVSGGHLATITSQEENKFITDKLLKYGRGDKYWLGGTDENTEGKWRWLYGSEPFSYTNWKLDEPNNDLDRENYLQIYLSGEWNDGKDWGYQYCGFILEIEKRSPEKVTEYNNHIYQRFDKGINYREAAEYCHMIGGKLVIINDSKENEFIQELINEDGTAALYWIGLADLEKTKSASGFKWTDDSSCSYSNWAKTDSGSQPDCWCGSEFYGEIYKDGSFNDNCNYTGGSEGFICELEKKVTSVSIYQLPSKRNYYVDEEFDSSDLALLVTYEYGKDEIITKGFKIEQVDMSTAGQKTIKVTYAENESTFTITVEKRRSPGDVNEDESIDLKDVVIIRRVLVSDWKGSYNEANADVNNDGSVDLKDVVTLRRYLVSEDVKLV